MARSDLLVSLVRAAAGGDRETLRSTAEALAADERAKKHHLLADRLQRALGRFGCASFTHHINQRRDGRGTRRDH